MNKYKSIKEIEAIKFEMGMEDGFDIRYTNNIQNEDGSIVTYSFKFNDNSIKIKTPYIVRDELKITISNIYYIVKEKIDNDIILWYKIHESVFEKEWILDKNN